jgi:hypothetical protein
MIGKAIKYAIARWREREYDISVSYCVVAPALTYPNMSYIIRSHETMFVSGLFGVVLMLFR